MPSSVNQNGQQVETAARLHKLQLDWPEAALPRFAGVMGRSVFAAASLAVLLVGDRLPSFERFLSCLAHPRKVIRAGRQNLTFVAVPHFKKGHISSSTVSTIPFRTRCWRCLIY